MHGEPPVQPAAGEHVPRVLGAVQSALDEFSGRLGLPEGQKARAIVYNVERADALFPLLGMTPMDIPGVVNRDSRNLMSPRYLLQGREDSDYMVAQALQPRQHGALGEHVVLEARGGGKLPAADQALLEDAKVLGRVLEKRVAGLFPDEYWGKDLQGRPGALGLVAGDWGPVVALNMTFRLDRGEGEGAPQAEDVWDATARELRGEPFLGGGAGLGGVTLFEDLTRKLPPSVSVQAAQLLQDVKETLADFGGRVRKLEPGNDITVLVFEGASAGLPFLFGGKKAAAHRIQLAGPAPLRRTSPATITSPWKENLQVTVKQPCTTRTPAPTAAPVTCRSPLTTITR
ncbi:MAG: hypothetical protein HY721_25455 [Planctomycetes bacterium]|nr:hypothetical protein [Planctomycetota bacterium]